MSANIRNKERKDRQPLAFVQKEMKPFAWNAVNQGNVQMLEPQEFLARQENPIVTIKKEEDADLDLSEDFGDIRNTSTPIICYENSVDDTTLHRRSVVSKASSALVVDENNNCTEFIELPLTRENVVKFTRERDEIHSNSRSIFLVHIGKEIITQVFNLR